MGDFLIEVCETHNETVHIAPQFKVEGFSPDHLLTSESGIRMENR